MDFADRVQELAAQIPKRLDHIETEEATKTAFVMPFISALGYDVFNPTEVVPEFTADVGIKKGEKIDYAILSDGKPILLFEVKSAHANLSNVHTSQLFRYFGVTDTRFAVLTNGIVYQFYSDIEKSNRMDERPFFVIDLLNIRSGQVEELKRFSKDMFDVEDIISIAGQLKYTREMKVLLTQQLNEPDEEFVRYFADKLYEGRITQSVRELFSGIVKQAMREFINERVSRRIQTALDSTDTAETPAQAEIDEPSDEETIEDAEDKSGRQVVTTDDEIEGYFVVKSILREHIDVHRVAIRDTKSYCGILLDDNNRKPICRLHFNRSQKYVGIFDADKNQDRIPIESIDEIYNYADRLKAVVTAYDSE